MVRPLNTPYCAGRELLRGARSRGRDGVRRPGCERRGGHWDARVCAGGRAEEERRLTEDGDGRGEVCGVVCRARRRLTWDRGIGGEATPVDEGGYGGR